MRCRPAHIVILATICLLAGKPHVHAQSEVPEVQAERSCPLPSAHEQASDPEISIVEVTFSGSLQMQIFDQDQIADSIKQQKYESSFAGVTDEALERVRAGWQDRGYFKVLVSGHARRLISGPDSQRVALSVHVDEGLQYSMGEITFKNNLAISDVAALRGLFPIKDGDIASREKIAKALDNLRRAYGDRGYINFTLVPDTKFEDERKLLFLDIDLDEGKQFHFGDFNIVGLDEPTRQELLRDFPIKHGQVYDGRLFESFMLRHPSISAPDDPNHIYRRLDERAGTVAITLDARPCAD